MAHRAKVVAAAQAKAASGMSKTRWPQAYLSLLVVGGQSRFLEDGSHDPTAVGVGTLLVHYGPNSRLYLFSGPVACGHI